MAMTFKDFVASGRDVADLGEEIAGMEGVAGRVYVAEGGLHIERYGSDWLLTIYNDQIEGDLPTLERELYDFAMIEGWV